MKIEALWLQRLRPFVPMLSMTAAYYVMGRLSLLLAIPPGYATAVWPASGIALAGALLYGYRVWPGIVLGSFLVNIGTSFDATSGVAILASVALAVSIGMGAALQAAVGGVLIRRFVGFPSPLDQDREIGLFLALGGPISCLVSATIGTASLVLGGVIPRDLLLFSWWTWWVGDTIGVITMTPLVLIWTAEPRQLWRRRRLTVAVPLGVAVVLAIIFFVYTSAREQDRIRLVFERQASILAQTLQTSFDGYLNVLHAIESFYASSREVDRYEFRTFVQADLSRRIGIQALEWIPRVPDIERARYEEAARRDGYVDFQITEQEAQGQMVPAVQRGEYFPVYYVEPYERNKLAMGFDMASNPVRLDAMRQARDTGEPVATARITLVQETGRQFGFLVFLPIYRNGVSHGTVAARRQYLHGYATGAFRVGDMVEASLHAFEWKDITLQTLDEAAPAGQHLLYSNRERTPEESGHAATTTAEAKLARLRWSTTIELAGRRWVLRFLPTLAYLTTHQTWQPWTVLAGGLLFTGLLGAFLLVVTGRTAVLAQTNDTMEREIAERTRAEETLAQQTRELVRSNAELEAANADLAQYAYVVSHDLKAPLRAIHNYTDFLREDLENSLDGDQRAYLDGLGRAVHEADALIDDLLKLSRLGNRELVYETLSLGPFLRDLVTSLQLPAEVEVRWGQDWPIIETEPTLLRQIVRNLLINALKFNRAASKRVELGWHPLGDARGELFVRDNGIGIEPRHHAQIFRVFQRLHTQQEYAGTGIGLAIVQKAASRLGGTVRVASTPGEGSTFFVTLPLMQKES